MTYVHKLSCWEIKLHEQKCKLKLKLKSNQRNNKKKKTKNLKKALRYLDHLDSSFFQTNQDIIVSTIFEGE